MLMKALENVIYEERLIEQGLLSIKTSELRSCCCLKLSNGSIQRR